MVPYVKKSFLKHYIESWITDSEKFKDLNLMDMLFDDYIDDFGIVRNKYEEWVDKNKSEFFKLTGLTEEDFRLDNKDNLNSKHYQQALYKTINETKQAVEGMYHNLNTLQSRSGNQLK
jgi:ribonucleoside-triphosphate reductase